MSSTAYIVLSLHPKFKEPLLPPLPIHKLIPSYLHGTKMKRDKFCMQTNMKCWWNSYEPVEHSFWTTWTTLIFWNLQFAGWNIWKWIRNCCYSISKRVKVICILWPEPSSMFKLCYFRKWQVLLAVLYNHKLRILIKCSIVAAILLLMMLL